MSSEVKQESEPGPHPNTASCSLPTILVQKHSWVPCYLTVYYSPQGGEWPNSLLQTVKWLEQWDNSIQTVLCIVKNEVTKQQIVALQVAGGCHMFQCTFPVGEHTFLHCCGELANQGEGLSTASSEMCHITTARGERGKYPRTLSKTLPYPLQSKVVQSRILPLYNGQNGT